MGRAIAELGWPRHSYAISTKVFWGLHGGVNMTNTLNRKYLMQAIDGSLERLRLDFVDLLFCHRSDPNTPIEETVWAMSDIIARGKALYWGTSEWSADEIRAACEIAERHHLRRPVVEQPQYHLTHRNRVEQEYRAALRRLGASGSPRGVRSRPGCGRASTSTALPTTAGPCCPGYEWLRDTLTDDARNQKVQGAGRHRRRARLHHRAARHRLVRAQPARVDRDHRREPRRTGARQPRALDVLPHLADRELRARINDAVGWVGVDM